MILTVNMDFLLNISKGAGCMFASGSFYAIISTEVMNMNTSEVVALIIVLFLLAGFLWIIYKTGGFKDDNS